MGETVCAARGIALFALPPRSPKLHGSVERANRTHAEEFYEVTDAPPDVLSLRAGACSPGRPPTTGSAARPASLADEGPPVVPSRTPTGADVRRGLRAEIAQLVEHATENRGVGSSSLPLGTTTPDAVIERKWLSW